MAAEGARVCAKILDEQGAFLKNCPDILRLTRLMASIGYEVTIAPLEIMAVPDHASRPSPVMPELLVRSRTDRAQKGQSEPSEAVAVQYIRGAMCFRYDNVMQSIMLEHLQFSETTLTNGYRLQLSSELSLN
jgi:hypothetical protein